MLLCKCAWEDSFFSPFMNEVDEDVEVLVDDDDEEEEEDVELLEEEEEEDDPVCAGAKFVFREDGLLSSSKRRSRWRSLMPVPITQRSSSSISSVDLSVGSGVMLLFAVGVWKGSKPFTDCSAAEPPRSELGIVRADSADICADVMLLIEAMDMADPGTPWNPPCA